MEGPAVAERRKMHGVWHNRWTFVLAATGSAVGLGNIWKFPYMTGENGGSAFVLVYLACIALIGIPIMVAEVLLGRRGRQSPINSMKYVTEEAGLHGAWTGIGWMGVVAGLFIMSFYSVVAGWALHYVFATAGGAFESSTAATAETAFTALLANKTDLFAWHTVFSVMTVTVVAAGVTRGLGMAARILMPCLFVILLVLLVYSMLNGNLAASFDFLFSPSFDRLSFDGLLAALGHAFFTLSLGMGAIMAYGAYMPERASLGRTVVAVGILDTTVALVAGLVIFSVVFANPGMEATSGPGLLFVSLPVAFGNMPAGVFFGTVFFVLVAIAAWTSAVSLIEPGVAWLVESGKLKRVSACLLLGGTSWLLGITAVLSFNDWAGFKPWYLLGRTPFGFLDFITAQVMLPLGGLFIAIFVGWFMKREVVRAEMAAESHPLYDVWEFVIRYISPVLLLLVFVVTLWEKLSGS
jgi:NSS family neurotransmitter:Na+ symporter